MLRMRTLIYSYYFRFYFFCIFVYCQFWWNNYACSSIADTHDPAQVGSPKSGPFRGPLGPPKILGPTRVHIAKRHLDRFSRWSRARQYIQYIDRHRDHGMTATSGRICFFIWLKVCCILSNVGGSEKSQLWVVIGGSEKNRLWCVATGMSDKRRHSKFSEWPSSALIHASSLFRHWSVA